MSATRRAASRKLIDPEQRLTTSQVRLVPQLSSEVKENQGNRQGEMTAPKLEKARRPGRP
jgi:hypothetical protein